ncbi:hypothetical protein ACCY16_10805 [Candidatus Pantoea formicae]|uniref:MrpH family fimbial adhesin n=1 Tax=Candidatus Pantoea formicae TaxID=2608355 RepID=UPI003ED9F99B
MKKIIIVTLVFHIAPAGAEIIMDDVTQKGFLITGTAVDNGAPYHDSLRCAPYKTDCKWGVRVKYYHGIFSYETWISGTVLTKSDGVNAPTLEEGRQAWIKAYGHSVPFSVRLPFYAKYPRVCWGASTVINGDFANCSSVAPGPTRPICSGSAGTIDFGSLQQDQYNGASHATSINISCTAAATIRFTSGSHVTLNNGTKATLTFNGYSQGSSFAMLSGDNTVRVNATLSGAPTLGDFTGSSTVILNVL